MIEGGGRRRRATVNINSNPGLAHLSRAMASELGGHSIRVNTVAPNGVDAHTWYRSAVLRTGRQDLQRKGAEPDFPSPADHLGQLEKMARAALFLVSPAASYITGGVIPVDCGWITSYHRNRKHA